MRPDRPPGMTNGPARPGRPIATSPVVIHTVASGDGIDRRRAALLDVLLITSAERDQWERRCLAYWSDGYRAGFEAGELVGTRRTMREWHVTAAGLPGAAIGPSWAELERRRYGPGGRAHFADPRPGDYTGGPVDFRGGRRRS